MKAKQLLDVDVAQFHVPGGVVRHIEANCARGLPELHPGLASHDGHLVVVGSSPSLADFADELRQERALGRPLLAVNGAHDWLCDHDLEPDLFLTIDPRDLRHNVQRQTANTIYLLASRCSPLLFEFLKDRKVVLWHAYSHSEETAYQALAKVPYLIGGSTTSGLRAITVGHYMGFRNFILYGMDSCLAPDGITKRVDGSLTGQTIDVYVGEGGPRFLSNVAMAQQAKEFQHLYTYLTDIHVEAKGDGLIAAILRERERRGLPV